jgi:predicted TIM-barrel fold metal-dependent hydrolase
VIVDVHSHAFRYPDHFNEDFREQAKRARSGVEVDLTVRYDEYRAGCPDQLTTTITFGGKARLSGLWVDDRYVADYVASRPDQLIGFLSVDPTQDGWRDEMRDGHQRLGLRGIKLLPMYAGFSPNDSRLAPLWRYAAVIRKHDNVYADISALHYRPFQFYHSLMLVQEYGVWHKLFFGTDYRFTTANATIETLGQLNEMFATCDAGRLDPRAIDEMIHRDALGILGPTAGTAGRDSE